MLKRPARRGTVTASPARMSGDIFTSVLAKP
jgi:hypothetical protein